MAPEKLGDRAAIVFVATLAAFMIISFLPHISV
jgi:hypothetical protein